MGTPARAHWADISRSSLMLWVHQPPILSKAAADTMNPVPPSIADMPSPALP